MTKPWHKDDRHKRTPQQETHDREKLELTERAIASRARAKAEQERINTNKRNLEKQLRHFKQNKANTTDGWVGGQQTYPYYDELPDTIQEEFRQLARAANTPVPEDDDLNDAVITTPSKQTRTTSKRVSFQEPDDSPQRKDQRVGPALGQLGRPHLQGQYERFINEIPEGQLIALRHQSTNQHYHNFIAEQEDFSNIFRSYQGGENIQIDDDEFDQEQIEPPDSMSNHDQEDAPMGDAGSMALPNEAQTSNTVGRQGARNRPDGQGFNRSDGSQGTVVKSIPRHIREKTFQIYTQRTVRYDMPGRSESTLTASTLPTQWIYTGDGTTPGLAPNNIATPGPGVVVQYDWYFMPTQTIENYLAPQDTGNIFQMCGLQGSIKFKQCDMKIFNTRLAMQLLSETGYLITIDKPWFKTYEDTEHQLFGHGHINITNVNDIRPSANLITTSNVHMYRPMLQALQPPIYTHTVQAPEALNPEIDYQLMLETNGGVNYHQAGDIIQYSWKLHGPATNIKNFDTGISDEVGFDVDGNNVYLVGYIGQLLPNFPMARYTSPEITTVETATRANRSEAHSNAPPMVLVSCPTITNTTLGGGNFDVQTELQCMVTYNAWIEITRVPQRHVRNQVTLGAGSSIQQTGNLRTYREMDQTATVFSSRTIAHKGPYTI